MSLGDGFNNASSGIGPTNKFVWKLPFLLLHLKQADTTFSQSDKPPFALETTWSKVSSDALNFTSQYWHLKWSLRNKLNLVKGILFFRGIYFFKEITLGNFIEKLEEWTLSSYSATIFTLSKNTALIVSCQPHKDKGK